MIAISTAVTTKQGIPGVVEAFLADRAFVWVRVAPLEARLERVSTLTIRS